jgi:hypothetical protein
MLLAVDEEGPIVVRAARTKDRGVKYDGVLYPDELLKQIGDGVYMLATRVSFPADGDLTRNFHELMPLKEVSQLEWSASWESYDRARRRLNADQLWERGGDISGMMRNAIMALVLAVSLFSAWGGFRSASAAGRLADQTNDLKAALFRVVELPATAPVAAPVTPTVGGATGDRVPPTVVPKRP